MAYKGKPVFLEDWLFNTQHSLIDQSKSADLTKFVVNGDGFGMGWYCRKTTPGLFKSIRPAWNNVNLKSLASQVTSSLFMAHVRAATGTAIQETNSHPFSYKNWLFVHNGYINEFQTVKKNILLEIDQQFFPFILGSTDSELIFFLLLSNGLEENVEEAVIQTVKMLEAIAIKHNIKPAVTMTLGISNGKSLWAVRYASVKAPSLFYSLERTNNEPRLLVVSEPLDDCSVCWTNVDDNSILHFTKDEQLVKTKIL